MTSVYTDHSVPPLKRRGVDLFLLVLTQSFVKGPKGLWQRFRGLRALNFDFQAFKISFIDGSAKCAGIVYLLEIYKLIMYESLQKYIIDTKKRAKVVLDARNCILNLSQRQQDECLS